MTKLDAYLRSIERFGAAGAVLNSGQPVTLRFPTGDRQATQVTPHDQLVILVREVAPPAVLDQIDKQRAARFEVDSEGKRYMISVSPKPGAWSVGIEPGGGAAAAPPASAAPPPRPAARAAAAVDMGADMAIERGQYDAGASPPVVTSSGSLFLDQLTTGARGARASDIYLNAGAPPLVRAGGELSPGDRGAIDGDLISRELGTVAPPEARAAWNENRIATFAYGDGAGRVRATLTRDHRGPAAALRLLHGEAPPLDRMGIGAEVTQWLGATGLILLAGPSGSGKTTTLAALIRALGERRRSVISIEDPIELLQTGPTVSQRAIGEHVRTFTEGVASATREGADAIVVGAVTSADAAGAVIDAVAGGHLVLTTIVAPAARVAIQRLLGLLPPDQRELARALCGESLLGTISPIVGRGGARTFEVAGHANTT